MAAGEKWYLAYRLLKQQRKEQERKMKKSPEAMANVIYTRGLVQHYYKKEPQIMPDGTKRRRTVIRAVDQVDLAVAKGEIVGVLGETGCGKSTLGRVLVGLERPTSGGVMLDGIPMRSIARKDPKRLRRQVQMVFQNPFDAFDPRHNIERVLVGTLKLHGIGGSHAERVELALEALRRAELHPAEDFMKRYPSELSGGQLQRIAIVRSMLFNPEFIVADEPVSMLDVSVRADIINMLYRVAKEDGTAMVFISHDISTTRYIADRIAVMYLGEIVEIGATDEVILHPIHPYTQALISNCPSANPLREFNPVKLEGDPPSAAKFMRGCRFAGRCQYVQEACHKTPQELEETAPDSKHFVRCMVMMEQLKKDKVV